MAITPPAGYPAGSAWYVALGPQNAPKYLTGDYDTNTGERRTLSRGLHPVDAWVQFQMRTRQGSGSAVIEAGTRYHEIKKINDGTKMTLRFETERWLKPAVDRGWIKVDTILVEVDPRRNIAAVFFAYWNLYTGKRREQRVPVTGNA